MPGGWLAPVKPDLQPLVLAPGDRLMFLTDGLLERNVSSLDIDALVAQPAQVHPDRRFSISSKRSSNALEASSEMT